MRISVLWLLFTLLIYHLTWSCDNATQICGNDARILGMEIKNELNKLFTKATQLDQLNKTFTETDLIKYEDLDGGKLLNVTSEKLKRILKLKTDAVDNIADFVRRKSPITNENLRDPPSCSYYLAKDSNIKDKINLTYRKEFNTEVNLTEAVIHVPTDVFEFSKEVKRAVHLTDGLDKVFIDNYLNDRFLFGQYFGSTSGLLRYYPAFYWDTENQTDYYDCRERPWYIEAAGLPRDIVFLMDISGSMFGWALRVAKYTAERLLTVISDKDYVAFYSFNKKAEPVSCYPNLERARLKYKKHLITKIKDIQANGASNFSLALEKAFEVLKNSSKLKKSCECQKVIIIFSDYVRSDYEEVFRRLNPDRKVRVFTLAFGAPNQWDTSKLRDIACNNNGYFSPVFNYGDVVKAISSIFNVFGQPLSRNIDKIQPSWSSVYYEYDRMNFVVTVGKSVVLDYKEVKDTKIEPFLGVAAIDVDIPQMNTIMTGMFSGIMYAFMVNNNGVIVVHPRLVPIEGFGQGTPDMDLNELEVTKEETDIIRITEKMLKRESDSEETKSLVSFPGTIRGKESFQNTKFFFTSLDGYPFSIGIVVPPSERQTISVNENKLNNTLIGEAVSRDVPHLLRWKKYPLCTLNITETIKFIRDEQVEQVRNDPCYPDQYNTMAAEVQLTEPTAKFWRSKKFKDIAEENKIIDCYLITNAGITRSCKNMTSPGTIMDPMDMQPFIHARRGIPPNRLLVSLLEKEHGYRSFNISYSLGIPVGSDIFEVLSVGIKVQLKVLRKLLNSAIGSRVGVTVTLLDESAFVIYNTADDYEEAKIKRFFDEKSPVKQFVKDSQFYDTHVIKDCQQLCDKVETNPHSSESSAFRISPLSVVNMFITSLWKIFLYFIADIYTVDRIEATHQKPKKVMCCEKYNIYSRDFSKTQVVEKTVDCGTCQKNLTLSPVPDTNLLLLIDNNPDCVCPNRKDVKRRYIPDVCTDTLSKWQSDLSQQSCFDEDGGGNASTSSSSKSEWKCFTEEK